MALGVCSNTDTEVVAMRLANISYQINGESEILVTIILSVHVVFLTAGRISS